MVYSRWYVERRFSSCFNAAVSYQPYVLIFASVV